MTTTRPIRAAVVAALLATNVATDPDVARTPRTAPWSSCASLLRRKVQLCEKLLPLRALGDLSSDDIRVAGATSTDRRTALRWLRAECAGCAPAEAWCTAQMPTEIHCVHACQNNTLSTNIVYIRKATADTAWCFFRCYSSCPCNIQSPPDGIALAESRMHGLRAG